MKALFLTTVIIACSFNMDVSAKRLAPKPVVPIVKEGIEYSVSNEKMGFVTARWLNTGKTIWSKQIYIIKFDYLHGLEGDVQDCFINSLKLKGNRLVIENERGSVFELDIESLQQSTIAGSAIVDHTKRTPQKMKRTPQKK